MTENQKRDFLELFCKYAPGDIISTRQADILMIMDVKDPAELATLNGYCEYYKQLSDIAVNVEKINAHDTQEKQVKYAIEFFKKQITAVDNSLLIATDMMIKARCFPNWNDENRNRYATGRGLIIDWIHLFISYTNSSKPAINITYRNLLKNQLGTPYFNRNKDDMNLIAALLYKFFKAERMNTFYDKEEIGWSDEWKDKIFPYAAKSIAFVQFIELEAFHGTSANNYCYKEYVSYMDSITAFSKSNNLQVFKPIFFFIISNPTKSEKFSYKPANLENDDLKLNTWAEFIKDKQYITLHEKMTDGELRIKIQEAANKIVVAKKEVFDNFLNSF
ncbi:MAG: hypothetical protein ABJB11_13735 [Ferruginibacter sp.]